MYMKLFIFLLIPVFIAGCGVNEDIHQAKLKELETKKTELDKALSETNTANEEIAGLKKTLQEKEQENRELSASLSEKEQQSQDLSAEMSTALDAKKAELDKALSETGAANEEIAGLKKTLQEKEQENNKLSAGLSEKEQQSQDLSAEMSAALDAKKAELDKALSETNTANEEIAGLKKTLQEKEQENNKLSAGLSEKELRIQNISERITAKDGQIEEISASKKAALRKATVLEEELTGLHREREHLMKMDEIRIEKEREASRLTNTIMAKNVEIRGLSAKISAKDAQIESISTRKNSALQKVAAMGEQLAGFQREREHLIKLDEINSEMVQKISKLTSKIMVKNEKIKELSNRISTKDSQIENISTRKNSALQEVAAMGEHLAGLQREREHLMRLDAIRDEKEQQVNMLTNNIMEKEAQIEELSEKISAKDEKMEEISKQKNAALQKEAALGFKLLGFQRERKFLVKLDEFNDKKLATLKNTYENLVKALKNEVERGEIKISHAVDSLSVKIVDKILFGSGKTTLKKSGREVLKKIGDILETVKDQQIMIKGHTDNVPIGKKIKEEFPSNWELSAMRAINVVHYLHEKVGISPNTLSATGYSKFRPVAANDTPEGRAQNRRIEIALLPLDIGKVLKELKK